MINPQGGPTYYNRGVPPGRLPPNPIMPSGQAGTGFTAAGASRPDPLAGWVSPYGPGGQFGPPQAGQLGSASGQMAWPQPGEIPPGSKDPGITPPFSWPPQGQGKGTTDTVPAWLSPGEGVLTPGAASAVGRGNITNLNSQYPPSGNKTGQAVTGYQMGTPQVPPGIVPPFAIARAQQYQSGHPWAQRYSPGAVAQHWQQRQGTPGYEGGIGYVPQSSIDPAWQNINLQAPGINIGALQQLAQNSRLSPTAISGLLAAVANAYKKKQAMGQGVDSSSGVYGLASSPGVNAPTGY